MKSFPPAAGLPYGHEVDLAQGDTMISRRTCVRLTAAAGLTGLAGLAQAQDPRNYPDRPVRLVVAKPPGGLDDAITRMLQPHMQRILGQPVVVENIPGANGIIGTQ